MPASGLHYELDIPLKGNSLLRYQLVSVNLFKWVFESPREAMARKQAEHRELAQLHMGKCRPLLAGTAIGPSALLWLACHTSPKLVHVFQDGQLLSIWRFPADPVHLLLGPPDYIINTGHDKDIHASLMIITSEGSIWQLKLTTERPLTERPSKRQKEDCPASQQNDATIVCETRKTTETSADSWDLFGDIDMYEHQELVDNSCVRKERTDAHSKCSNDLPEPSGLQIKSIYITKPQRKRKLFVVSKKELLGVVPGACLAALGPSKSIIVFSGDGSAQILMPGSLASISASLNFLPMPNMGTTCKGYPTCALLASRPIHQMANFAGSQVANLPERFFEIFQHSDAFVPQQILFEGCADGKVFTVVANSRHEKSSMQLFLDLKQPIVAVLASRIDQVTNTDDFLLLVVGAKGLLIAFVSEQNSDIVNETIDDPFSVANSPGSYFVVGSKMMSQLKRYGVTVRELKIASPVLAACLIGPETLCYCAGTEIYVANLVHEEKTVQRPKRWVDIIKSQKAYLADVIVALTGKCSITSLGGNILIALTSRGRLISVDVSRYSLLPVEPDTNVTDEIQRNWTDSQARMEEKIKETLKSISDAAAAFNIIKEHEQSLSSAIHEIATALKLMYSISADPTRARLRHINVPFDIGYKSSHTGLACAIDATAHHKIIITPDKLSFEHSCSRGEDVISPSKFLGHLTVKVSLVNHNPYAISLYWSLLLEIAPRNGPRKYYSSVINNGHGLASNAHCKVEFNVQIPSETMDPVIASVFLCHVHDFHGILCRQWPENGNNTLELLEIAKASSVDLAEKFHKQFGDARFMENSSSTCPAGVACILLCQYRFDIFTWTTYPVQTEGHKTGSSQNLYRDNHVMGPFAGSFHVRSDTVTKETWRKLCMEDLPEKGIVSKSGLEVALYSPCGEVINILLDVRSGAGIDNCSSVHFEASSLHLGCLVREALLGRLIESGLMASEIGEYAISDTGKGFMDAQSFLDGIQNNLESIAHRSEAVLRCWNSIESDLDANDTASVVKSTIADTYTLVEDMLEAYRAIRNHPRL